MTSRSPCGPSASGCATWPTCGPSRRTWSPGPSQVTGSADSDAIRAASPPPGSPSNCSSRPHPPSARSRQGALPWRHRRTSVTTASPALFSTDATGLPQAVPTSAREYDDGATVDLRMAPVAKRSGTPTVRMLAYEGSVPGPTFVVRQGSRLDVRAVNDTELETTVHWHGLRLENRFDGVPYDDAAADRAGQGLHLPARLPRRRDVLVPPARPRGLHPGDGALRHHPGSPGGPGLLVAGRTGTSF